MSWGTKIAMLYGGFVVLILALVFRASMENVDLESADYYAKEIAYQEQIDGENAVNATGLEPHVVVDATGILVEIPGELSAAPMTGSLEFFRPDNANFDKNFEITSGSMHFDAKNFISGHYRVNLQWNSRGQDYRHETTIYFP